MNTKERLKLTSPLSPTVPFGTAMSLAAMHIAYGEVSHTYLRLPLGIVFTVQSSRDVLNAKSEGV